MISINMIYQKWMSSNLVILSAFILLWYCPGVMTSYINVAFRKPTRQVDTQASLGESRHAVDGNHNTNYYQGSCSHTAAHSQNWWAVDLMTSYPVHSIRITNRFRDYDLKDFSVLVSESNPISPPYSPSISTLPGKECFRYTGTFYFTQPKEVTCQADVTGRFVYVWKPGPTKKICLCELEVLVDESYVNAPLQVMEKRMIVLQGKITSVEPYKSVVLADSRKHPILCVSFCIQAKGGVLTQCQFNQMTGQCECIEHSPFYDDNVIISNNPDWVLYQSVNN